MFSRGTHVLYEKIQLFHASRFVLVSQAVAHS